ncbi:unnamed protein product [Pedinophyceae sp. YPF-701]|nr:unnamed protein product [Pedinophyceae sp. YPF-701]
MEAAVGAAGPDFDRDAAEQEAQLDPLSLQVFEDERFDAAAWLNGYLRDVTHKDAAVEALTGLETKLQLVVEDVEGSLERLWEKSTASLEAVTQEVAGVTGDVSALLGNAQRAKAAMAEIANTGRSLTHELEDVSLVRDRMESTRETLAEAASVGKLFPEASAALQRGDLPRAATILASVRRSVAIVRSVPGIASREEQLRSLETRLQSLVESSLGQAVRSRDAGQARTLLGLLEGLSRADALTQLYLRAATPALQALWGQGNPAESGFATWLEGFFTRVAGYASDELEWLRLVAPAKAAELLAALLSSFVRAQQGALSSRLRSALGAAQGGAAASGALATLQGAVKACGGFLVEIEGLLVGAGDSGRVGIPRAQFLALALDATLPVARAVHDYGKMQQEWLAGKFAAAEGELGLEAARRDFGAAVGALEEAAPVLESSLREAVDTCAALTAGSESPGLSTAVDNTAPAFLSKLAAALRASAARAAATSDAAGAAVRAIRAAHALAAVVRGAESHARVTCASRLGDVLETPSGAAPPEGTELLHVSVCSSPKTEARLEGVLANMRSSSAQAMFGSTLQALKDVDGAVEECVRGVALNGVAKAVSGVAALPCWTEDTRTAGSAPTPSFSAYPQLFATTVGEHLMALPALLEPLAEGADDADAANGDDAPQDFDAERWLDALGSSAADVVIQALAGVPRLSDAGAAQMAADLEYVGNVLSALGVAAPPSLQAWGAALGEVRGGAAKVRAAVQPMGAAGEAAASAILRMRGQ